MVVTNFTTRKKCLQVLKDIFHSSHPLQKSQRECFFSWVEMPHSPRLAMKWLTSSYGTSQGLSPCPSSVQMVSWYLLFFSLWKFLPTCLYTYMCELIVVMAQPSCVWSLHAPSLSFCSNITMCSWYKLEWNHNFIQLLRFQTLFHAMAIIFLLVWCVASWGYTKSPTKVDLIYQSIELYLVRVLWFKAVMWPITVSLIPPGHIHVQITL